jgi:sulfoxide reductase heme-binding subunit YedZ
VVRVLTVGLGYVGLLFIIFTLLVGPYKLLWQRRNPVNINLRRDIGIWAGLTGAAHVVVGFQVHQRGRILRYFFNKDGEFLTNLFGASNVAGLFATLLIILLLLLSNDISLKQLKGPRWKFLQRFNYVLFVLVVAHTFGYQMEINREAVATYAVIGLTWFLAWRDKLRGQSRLLISRPGTCIALGSTGRGLIGNCFPPIG